jgi:hypothetical protein
MAFEPISSFAKSVPGTTPDLGGWHHASAKHKFSWHVLSAGALCSSSKIMFPNCLEGREIY